MLSAEGKEIERIQSKVCSMLSAEGKGKDRIQSKVYSMLSAEGSGPPRNISSRKMAQQVLK